MDDYPHSATPASDDTAPRTGSGDLRWAAFAEKALCILWTADVEVGSEGNLCWSFRLFSEPAARRLLPLDVVPGERFTEAWYQSRLPEDRERADRFGTGEIRANRSYTQEYRCCDRFGKIRWFEESVHVEAVTPGRWRTFGATLDITEKKSREEELRQSEERFRTLFQHAAIGVALIDPLHRITLSNPALQRILGYSDVELAGRRYQELTDPRDRAREARLYRQLVSGQRDHYELEKRFVRSDGRIVWGEVTASIVRDGAGNPLFGIGLLQDVTERHEAARRTEVLLSLGEQLNGAETPEEAAERILAAANELLGWDACFLELTDLEAGTSQTVVMMDTIGKEKQRVQPPGNRIPPLAARALNEGPTLILRVPGDMPSTDGRFGDKSRPSASLACVPIRSSGRAIGALSIQSYQFGAYDRSSLQTLQALADYCAVALERTRSEMARRQLEQQFHHASKMEAIGRLAGGVAHDNNNMLAVINGYSELLLGMVPPGTPVHNGLQEIRKAGERAAALTRQLLAFGRKAVVRPQRLQLNEVIRATSGLLRRLIREDIELVLDLAPQLGIVSADAGQLEQILMNLAANARDAMPAAGRLTFRTMNVELDADAPHGLPPGTYVCLLATDTGVGMDEATQSQIFEPFFTTKGVGAGTGLGLATVYAIVEQSGGRIDVESKIGVGTAFRILLPLVAD